MKKPNFDIYILDHFEGQLNFLFQLVQKSEIEITDISLKQIIDQFRLKNQKIGDSFEEGAEFIGTTSSLIWWKSKQLLPKHEQNEGTEELKSEFEWNIIPQLVDYCRFKQMAKELNHLEQEQSLHYFRGSDQINPSKKNLGVEHLSLEDLASLFKQVLSKATQTGGCIFDENWKVSDKIAYIRLRLNQLNEISFDSLFSPSLSRLELVATFLAILELMKLGEIKVIKNLSKINSYIICHKNE